MIGKGATHIAPRGGSRKGFILGGERGEEKKFTKVEMRKRGQRTQGRRESSLSGELKKSN